MKIRTYSELKSLDTFEERYDYLNLNGIVGDETFGSSRFLNQVFYHSDEWRRIRDEVIVRDLGCDLGIEGYDIHHGIIIHHMNPITKDDILSRSDFLLNPEYLICTAASTHKAIHYGNFNLLGRVVVDRSPNDTCPWK